MGNDVVRVLSGSDGIYKVGGELVFGAYVGMDAMTIELLCHNRLISHCCKVFADK